MSLRRLCVVPAKGRSTRLPGKNLATLGGRPLVARTVDVARACGLFDTVAVSTDDDAIAACARDAGADVPFRRGADLTVDGVEVDAVVEHAVRWFEDRGRAHAWVCTLQPTSPLRTADDLTRSWALLAADPQADAVVSVSVYGHHPLWALSLHNGTLTPQFPDSATASRSHLPHLVHPDGCLYWQRCAAVLQGTPLYAGRVLAYATPRASAVDVDHPEDLAYAAWLLEQPRR